MAEAARPPTHAHGFSPARLATLEHIFDTIVPGQPEAAGPRVRTAVETLDAVGDHAELRLLRLALWSLELPVANLLLTGRWGAFSRMSPGGREAVLRRWSTHPIARLRSAFQALKRLASFLAWSDPGEAYLAGSGPPANPLWERAGYAVPGPVAIPAMRVTPLDVDRAARGALQLEADVVIVGSGAGAGVVAARLAAAGRSVLVVEGGHYRPESEMPVLEGEAWRDLYLDRGATATHDLSVTILAGSGLGGGTTVNWTTSLPPPDWLRDEWVSEHGLEGFDDSQTDADLARLRLELQLMAPSVVPPKDQMLLAGAAALGIEAAHNERNAGPCDDCGACGFGCRRGSKRSGLRAHLAQAADAGARFLVDAPVSRITLEDGRAAGVVGQLRRNGERGRAFSVRARQVVLAAGALRSPLILQRSGVEHPAIGHYLRLHPVTALLVRMREPVEAWCGPLQAARSLHFWRPGGRDADGIGPAHGGFVIESAAPHPGLMAAAAGWNGGERTTDFLAACRYLAPLIALVRDSGPQGGRVRWSRGGHPRIEYRISSQDGATAQRSVVEMARLARAGGARSVTLGATPPDSWAAEEGDAAFTAFLHRLSRVSTAPNRLSLFSAHQMGTVRAGADPATHPCDPHGRVRASTQGEVVPGLFVGDASLFPSGSGVNPMVTVMALAERTARAVLADA